jgi:hypothetical protein
MLTISIMKVSEINNILAQEIYIFINNNYIKKVLKNLPKLEKYILFKTNKTIIKVLGQDTSFSINYNYNKSV